MSPFAYTTGNPDNLVGGETAAMTDIQGPFNDIKAFLNAPTMMAAAELPDLLARIEALEARVSALET